MSALTLSFAKVLCCSSLFPAENSFNTCITIDCFFFSIKLSLLNPKSDLNLIVCGFHNVLRIITEIEITSIT